MRFHPNFDGSEGTGGTRPTENAGPAACPVPRAFSIGVVGVVGTWTRKAQSGIFLSEADALFGVQSQGEGKGGIVTVRRVRDLVRQSTRTGGQDGGFRDYDN